MIGRTIAQYRIERKLGEGGMGQVYLAEDSTLKRSVAIKVLPPHLQEHPEALKRFLREAEAAASLEHPYICNIKEFSQTDDGHQFIVMEYVEGQTLKEKLEEGLMPVHEAVRIALEVAEALELAHERGIVHRDLKPSNIMLTPQGHAKVMDFGLAKRIMAPEGQDQETTLTLTGDGSTLGTLAYMSPEQFKGSSVDARSDIFSFGIFLYEMLTGVHPFRRGQPIETASAILTADPEPLTRLGGAIPEHLDQTVLKMLARAPEERFGSIGEVKAQLSRAVIPSVGAGRALSRKRFWSFSTLFLAAIILVAFLGWWTFRGEPTASGPRFTSIAVLPLANGSGDAEQDYFVDGMTEALITDLSKISSLKVIARSSSMSYKNTNKSLSDIAQELGVEVFVEGSVFREKDRVGITAQLIEASTGHNLWANRYERNLSSILSLQGEIAQAISREIRATLTPGEEARLVGKREVDPEAYELYLKGKSHFYRLTPGDFQTALQYFEKALKVDPDFARPHAGIALVWLGRRQIGLALHSEASPIIREAISNAFERDDSNVEAYYALALEEAWGAWNWEEAEKAFLRAIELDPNYAETRAYYSHFLMIMKRQDESSAQMKLALELDPLNPLFQLLRGILILDGERRFEETIEFSNEILKVHPNNSHAWARLVEAYYAKGMFEETYQAALANWTARGIPEAVAALELGYSKGGFTGAMAELAEWKSKISPSGVDISSSFNYAASGQIDEALDVLERAFEVHSPSLPYIGLMVQLHDLHQETRFQKMLARLNFPDEVLAEYLNEYRDGL